MFQILFDLEDYAGTYRETRVDGFSNGDRSEVMSSVVFDKLQNCLTVSRMNFAGFGSGLGVQTDVARGCFCALGTIQFNEDIAVDAVVQSLSAEAEVLSSCW